MNVGTDARPRRDFLSDAGRHAAMAGVLLLGGGLAVKRLAVDPEKCRRRIPCLDCTALTRCEYPAALAARTAAGGETRPS